MGTETTETTDVLAEGGHPLPEGTPTVLLEPGQIDPSKPGEIRPIPDHRDRRIVELEQQLDATRAELVTLQRAAEAERRAAVAAAAAAIVPPREPTPEERRVLGRRAEHAHRAHKAYAPQVASMVETSGLPPAWKRAIRTTLRPLGHGVSVIVALQHPEAGRMPSREEVQDAIEATAAAIRDALLAEYCPEATS